MKKRTKWIWLMTVVLVTLLTVAGCIKQQKNTTMASDKIDVSKVSIAKDELKEKLGNTDYVLIDVRPVEAYNGWKLHGEARGGHIKGAVDFPLTWTLDKDGNTLNDKDLMLMLEGKGVTADKQVVVYGYNSEQAVNMSKILNSLGYDKVLIYDSGIQEWATDESLPMHTLANYDKLVYPAWIKELVDGGKPDTYSGEGYKIFEVSWGEPKDYNNGHIPGAYHLDTNELEEEPLWNRKSDQDIEAMLLKYGVTFDTTVVVYGADSTAAARAASIFMYAGVEDVRLLNGSYQAWVASGYEIETQANEPTPVAEFGVKVPAHPEYIIDTKQAKAILADDNSALVSIRSWPEYIGETSGYTYIKPKGRIKGTVWGHAGSDAYHMEDFRNIDNTMRNYHDIEAFWQEWGITPDKNVSFFCGTGWRASEAFFDAYLMGWENISVYDGGWYEWSADKSNPTETGEPK